MSTENLRKILDTDELEFIQDQFRTKLATVESPSFPTSELYLSGLVPPGLQHLLASSELTLLSEIEGYKLWFPLTFDLSPSGQLEPHLGIPEVLETGAKERSWRLRDTSDIVVFDETGTPLPLLLNNISSSGMSANLQQSLDYQWPTNPFMLGLSLPGIRQPLSIPGQLVRQDKSQLAINFKSLSQPCDDLRAFLFKRHKSIFQNIYKSPLTQTSAKVNPSV